MLFLSQIAGSCVQIFEVFKNVNCTLLFAVVDECRQGVCVARMLINPHFWVFPRRSLLFLPCTWCQEIGTPCRPKMIKFAVKYGNIQTRIGM